jgi:hypothetical protein
LRQFIKFILAKDYIPTDIKIKMNSKTALVNMNSKYDLDDFMNRYNAFAAYSYSNFLCGYYKPKNERINPVIYDPYNMFRHFGDLKIHDPNRKPYIIKNLVENEQTNSDVKDDLASIIYEAVEKKDAEYIYII